MNEQKFVYEHFNNLSYNFAAWSVLYIGFLFMPILGTSFALAYLVLMIPALLFPLLRVIKFSQSNKNISQSIQKQIIKRHRFSLNWIWLIFSLSVLMPFAVSLFFELDLIFITGIFGLTTMFSMFVFLRLFLSKLQQRMASQL